MFVSALTWFAISIYTIVLGTLAIIFSFVLPGSDTIPRFGKLWSFLILRTAGVRISVMGEENIERKNICVYIANHQSFFDVFALLNILPSRTRILAKRSLFFIPVFGWSLSVAGYISVKRDRKDDLMKSFEKVAQKIRRGRPILFFAEGGRSHDGKLQDFKKGAFLIALKAGVPIIPIALSGGHRIMPPNTAKITPGMMRIIIGKPIATEKYSISRLQELMGAVHTVIAENLEKLQDEEH